MTVYRRIERFADPQTEQDAGAERARSAARQRHHSGVALHVVGFRAARMGPAVDERPG